jgi:hypothetical protein
MNARRRFALTVSALALSGGLTAGGAIEAGASTAYGDSPAASQAASSVTHRARLWTQVSGGRNGYVDITHTYTAVGRGYYQGVMKGSLHHYYAPSNRQVVVVFRVDGTLGGWSRVTTSNTTFNRSYSHAKKVSARICLHRAGVPIHLYSGVSYCSAWWG